MIYLYKGAKGKGKTLSMVKDAYLFHLDKRPVFTNMKTLNFGQYISNEEILKIDKNSKIKKCCLLIDEIQTLFNARRSMKKENVDFSHFIQQIRKRDIDLLSTSQFSNTVDLIFRQHVDIIATPRFDKELLVCKVEYLDMNSLEDNMIGEIQDLDVVSVVYDAREIFGKYDTEELIV